MVIYRNINGVDFGININKGAGLICTQDIASEIDDDIYEFVEYLYSRTEQYTPMIATWEITNVCNFSCPFCYINTPNKKENIIQPLDKMKEYIDDLVEKGLLIVYLTGGEVLSVPHFIDIYMYLKNKGVFVVLLTNLSLLNDEHMKIFKEYPPLRITTSIYGINEKQFTEVTGQSFEVGKKVLSNILKIKESGITITCQMPLNTYTLNDFIGIADWCYNNGIRFTFNNELTDSYYNESRSDNIISDEQFDDLKSKVKQIEKEQSSKVFTPKRKFGYRHHFDCVSGHHTFAISYNAHLRPCFNIFESDCEFFDGSISMKNAMNEMENYINKMRNIVIEGCNGCEACEICGECIYTQLKHKNELNHYIKKKCAENIKKIRELTT